MNNKPHRCIKTFQKGGWVCWETFTPACAKPPRRRQGGTFKRFATSFSRVSQISPQVKSYVANKTSKNPLGKGWEAYPTAFSMQR
jgi:hypothetical protein